MPEPIITLTVSELAAILSHVVQEIDYDIWKEINFDYEGVQQEDDPEWTEGKWFRTSAAAIVKAYNV